MRISFQSDGVAIGQKKLGRKNSKN